MNRRRAGSGWNGVVALVLAMMLGLPVAVCATWSGTAYAEEQGAAAKVDNTLRISIAFDKESYAADEKVHAVITGTNASDEPLRDAKLVVAVPAGYKASGDTQTTVAKLNAGSSQTLDVYLEPNAEPAPDDDSDSDDSDADDNADDGADSHNNATVVRTTTGTATPTDTAGQAGHQYLAE